jgi:hypothetical protein
MPLANLLASGRSGFSSVSLVQDDDVSGIDHADDGVQIDSHRIETHALRLNNA